MKTKRTTDTETPKAKRVGVQRLVHGLYDRVIGTTRNELATARQSLEAARRANKELIASNGHLSATCYEHYQQILELKHRIRCIRLHFKKSPRALPLP